MIVVADTSPINYLVLLGHIEILPKIYGEVLYPRPSLMSFRTATHPQTFVRGFRLPRHGCESAASPTSRTRCWMCWIAGSGMQFCSRNRSRPTG